jgi:TPR repeat protein
MRSLTIGICLLPISRQHFTFVSGHFYVNRLVSLTLLLAVTSTSFAEDVCYVAYWDTGANEAEKECRANAETGNAEAQFHYGLILLAGHGRETKSNEAFEWFLSSAKQGNNFAQTMLGRMLSDVHSGIPINLPRTYAWWSISNNRSSAAALWLRLSPRQQTIAKGLAEEYEATYSGSK